MTHDRKRASAVLLRAVRARQARIAIKTRTVRRRQPRGVAAARLAEAIGRRYGVRTGRRDAPALVHRRWRPATSVVRHDHHAVYRLSPRIELTVVRAAVAVERRARQAMARRGAAAAPVTAASSPVGQPIVTRIVSRSVRVERAPDRQAPPAAAGPGPHREAELLDPEGPRPSPARISLRTRRPPDPAVRDLDREPAPAAPGRAPWQQAIETATPAAPASPRNPRSPAPALSRDELDRVTDKVMAAIDRRLVAQRERQGRR